MAKTTPKKKPTKAKAKPKKTGRPSKYHDKVIEQARKLCLLGATDKEMADFFNVTEKTFNNWKNTKPDFLQSLKEAKILADAQVADSLFNKACGYSHKAVHISNYLGDITQTEYIKHYPPDTAAAYIWLKNRQPDKWRERRDNEQSSGEVAEALAKLMGTMPD